MVTDSISQVEHSITVQHIRKGSSKPFDAVVTTFESLLGKPTMESIREAVETNQGEVKISAMQGQSGFMILGCLDMGAVIPTLRQKDIRAKQYLIGNPLFADQMIRHNVEAGLYAPLRVFLFEDQKGSSFVFDRPSTLFGQWHSLEIDNVAQKLDRLLDNLIDAALKD